MLTGKGKRISISLHGCALPTSPLLCPLSSRESRDLVGHGAYRMSPVQGEPLTAWKLRYKASSMRDVDTIVILPAPCISSCLPARTRIRFVLISLHSIVARSIPVRLVIPHSPHPSRCSRRVACAHTTATTPALTRTGQVWRCRTLIRERRAYTCAHLEGMLYKLPVHGSCHDVYIYSVLSSQASSQSSLLVYLPYCPRPRRRTSSPSIHKRHHSYRPSSPRP